MLLCGCMDWIIVQTQSCRPWTEKRCALSCLEPQSLYHCLGSSLSRHIKIQNMLFSCCPYIAVDNYATSYGQHVYQYWQGSGMWTEFSLIFEPLFPGPV